MIDRVLVHRHGHSALLLTVVSLVAWSSWYLLAGPRHPYGDLSNGVYTDHFSHMNTARLFTHAGIDIWTKPLQSSVVPLSPAQMAVLPPDMTSQAGQQYPVFTVPGWPADKPFVSSWAAYPRFHPPGDMVLTAPVALLYSFTGLSFSGANRLLVLSFLVLAHISLFVLLKSGISIPARPIGFLVLFVVYLEMIHWSLEGFYEAALIAPLVLCGLCLEQRRGLQAIALFALAAALHFRAYFFAPLAVYGAYIVVRDRQWRTWSRQDYGLAGVASVLCAISLGVFSLITPWLREVPATNPVSVTVAHPDAPAIATLLLVAAVVAVVFAYARSWLDMALLGWLTVSAVLLQQTWEWDVLTILAWLALPIGASAARRYGLVRDARAVAVIFLGMFVFKNMTLLDPSWLQKVFQELH
jgi:hypothetical protein